MKSTTYAALAAFASTALAYPSMMEKLTGPLALNALQKRQTAPPQGAGALPVNPPPFDPKLQYVSNQGAHAFVAPGAGDDRGECPGLNAMANHGYIPRNGRATIAQFINGTETAFGMAPDLGGFLAVYGALVDGDGKSWSIGGKIRTGILGSHNNYEVDSSPLKSDLNQYGSNSMTITSQFLNLYNRQPNAATANYNLEVMRAFRASRFQESIAKNPYFTYLPFTGIEVSQAAFTFIYRFMSNKSAEYPEGRLDKNTLKSFMSFTGPDNNLTHTPGHERIPDNWYKRHPSDEYSITYFQTDILYFAQTAPQILTIGCNMGKVNTYTTIDLSVLTGGAYTAAQIAKNPVCFTTQYAVASFPLITGFNASALGPLLPGLATFINKLGGCPTISNLNQSALVACPGFSFYGGPTGPVAPGAIQS